MSWNLGGQGEYHLRNMCRISLQEALDLIDGDKTDKIFRVPSLAVESAMSDDSTLAVVIIMGEEELKECEDWLDHKLEEQERDSKKAEMDGLGLGCAGGSATQQGGSSIGVLTSPERYSGVTVLRGVQLGTVGANQRL